MVCYWEIYAITGTYVKFSEHLCDYLLVDVTTILWALYVIWTLSERL